MIVAYSKRMEIGQPGGNVDPMRSMPAGIKSLNAVIGVNGRININFIFENGVAYLI